MDYREKVSKETIADFVRLVEAGEFRLDQVDTEVGQDWFTRRITFKNTQTAAGGYAVLTLHYPQPAMSEYLDTLIPERKAASGV